MSRLPNRNARRVAATAGSGAVGGDKFFGLVEKRPGMENSAPAAVSASSSSRSASSRPLHQASAPPNKALDRLYAHARATGSLVMDNMGLNELPNVVCHLYDPENMLKDERIWETVDLTSISVQHNALETLPSDVVNLAHLTSFNLSHNTLTSLPDELFDLSTLKLLNLSSNKLASLSPALGKLGNLVELNLASNALRVLPESIGELMSIQVLTLDDNQLTSLPESIANLHNLLRFSCNKNQLSSLPTSIGRAWTRLTHLSLRTNSLRSLPPLSAMDDLIHLDMSENQLIRLPPLSSSPRAQLTQLHVAFNNLESLEMDSSGAPLIMPAMLTLIDAHNNRLESIPISMCSLDSKLKHLDVSNNDLSDIPGEVGLMMTLNKLIVDGNPLRKFPKNKLSLQSAGGQGIHALKKYLLTRIPIERLERLSAKEKKTVEDEAGAIHLSGDGNGNGGMTHSANPDLSAALRTALGSHVLDLSLIRPAITSFPSDGLFNSSLVDNLRSMDLSNTRIPVDAIPTQIEMLRKTLQVFKANHVGWDVLPESICRLINLQELHLDTNALSSLPQSICNLASLRVLSLAHNRFSIFPPTLVELGRFCRSLSELNLQGNALRQLPEAFCRSFRSLRSMDLSNNKLHSLPECGWKCMKHLEQLNVENNVLNGIPLEVGLIPNLSTILLHGNPQRTVPQATLRKGSAAIVAALKNKIPLDLPLLREEYDDNDVDEGHGRGGYGYQEGMIDVDTAQRDRYGSCMRSGGSVSSHPSSASHRGARYERDDDVRREEYAARPSRSGVRAAYDQQDAYEYDRGTQHDADYGRGVGARAAPSHAYGQQGSYRANSAASDPYDRSSDNPARSHAYTRSRDYDQRPPLQAAAASMMGSDPPHEQANPYPFDARRNEDMRRRQQPPLPNQQQYSYSTAAPSSYQQPPRASPSPAVTSGHDSSTSPDVECERELASLASQISSLTNELESNLSLGNLQRMKMRKELASMRAEYNRKQQAATGKR